jgi:hypothetical protein
MTQFRRFQRAYEHIKELRAKAARIRHAAAVSVSGTEPSSVNYEGDLNRVVVINTGNPSSAQSASAISVSPISQDGVATRTEPDR